MKRPRYEIENMVHERYGASDRATVLAYLAHVEAVSALRGAECRAARFAYDHADQGELGTGCSEWSEARAATDAAGALDE